jgi:hypothetical protein
MGDLFVFAFRRTPMWAHLPSRLVCSAGRRDTRMTLPVVFPKKIHPRPVPFHPYFYILFIRHYTLLALLDPSLFFFFFFLTAKWTESGRSLRMRSAL